MAHDREFQRKRKDTRMPVRDSHGEDQPAARQTEQDFDLRRARAVSYTHLDVYKRQALCQRIRNP